MTLIFSHISDQTGLLVASDLLTSRPAHFEKEEVQLPVKQKPIIHDNAGSAIAGLSQKTIIIDRTLVSFAGSFIVAKSLLAKIQRELRGGQRLLDLQDLVESSGLSAKEIADVSLIYHFINGDYINRQTLNCLDLNKGQFDNITGQGTGSWNFFDNFEINLPGTPSHVQVIQRLVSRIANNFVGEILGTDTLDYMYGGWFELTTRSADTYTKIPYGIKFWSIQNKVMASGGPALMSWYHGHHLNVTKFPITGQGPEKDYPSSTIFVPDLLQRGLAGRPETNIRPNFYIHVVFDLDREFQQIIVVPDPEADGFEMIITPVGPMLRYSQDFYLKLLRTVLATPREK